MAAGRKAKVYYVRDDYRPLLKRVKKLFPTLLKHIRTKRILLVGIQVPTSKYIAQIRKNAYPWATVLKEYDYVITFWATRFDEYRKSKKLYVVLHELLHIPEGGFDRENKRAYRKLKNHNVEDFSELIDAYGYRLENVKNIYKGEGYYFKKMESLDERERIK